MATCASRPAPAVLAQPLALALVDCGQAPPGSGAKASGCRRPDQGGRTRFPAGSRVGKPAGQSAEMFYDVIPKPESFECLQRFGTAVGLKRPNLRRSCRLGLLSPTASSNSSPRDRSELSGFGIAPPISPLPWRIDNGLSVTS